MAEAPVAEALQANAEEVGIKVFVGNIAFATSADDIKSTFSSAGEILDAQIIKRGSRSLGYGFVTFKNEEDATKAVSSLDKSDLGGRSINVEIAKPAKSAPGGDVAQAAADAAEGTTGGRGRGRARRGRGGARGGRAPKPDGEADAAPAEANGVNGITDGVAGLSTEDAPARGGRSGRGRGRGGRSNATPRRPVGPPQGEPSQTLIFVANLPFATDDDGLKAIFEGYKVKTSHVVKRKYGHMAGKSKGFGFIDFESHDDQTRAVEQFHGKETDINGVKRELSVKVAIDVDRAEAAAGVEGDETAKPTETVAAPAATTTTEA